ncbi:Zn-ribbon domain-containing OB-fold protein [Mycobacterium bourgelatii]|uniref:DNA-binding protein n=1 Tax=Mycobacterium bourgelatii TaxID=1273442 RepID=A0A7I9YJ53_MYCBU|nr:OB-fold domain-containing protein [Mycobacterium bourgelatii]GFG88707.1 DNA-binding protein [Mycobacterium bourgelatii]
MTAGSVEPIDREIMEIDDGHIHLIGGQCGECGETGFPRQNTCRRCSADRIATVRLAQRGVLWSWTIQRFPPPSPPFVASGDEFVPFGVGYVELPGQVIVEARLTESNPDALRIGMPMRVTALQVPAEEGGAATTFAFAPIEEGELG